MYRLLAKISCFSLIAGTSATLLIGLASAQTITSGDILGTVTDLSGAVQALANS